MAESKIPASAPGNQSRYSRKNPFLTKLTRHDRLTKPGSEKDTRHFVLQLADGGLTYSPGDSLGAFAQNPPALVDEVIALLGFPPDTPVKNAHADPSNLRETLLKDYT